MPLFLDAAVWNVIQDLGDKLVHDEKELVETGKKEDLRESREVSVFEEEKLEGIAGSCFLWRGIKESLRGLRLCTKKTVARLPLGAAL